MPTPHDALFKFTFSDPEHAAAILRTALPLAIARRVDWSTLEALPGELVGEGLTAQQTDLLFQVRIGGRLARLILLFEHQSQVDPWMLLRLLGYVVQIWRDQQREHPDEPLPAVIPVVLHHSDRGWTAATELVELVDLEPEDREAVLPYLPNFRMVLDDLTLQADEDLRDRVEGAAELLTLLLLKNLRRASDPAALLRGYLPLLAKVLLAPSGLASLEALLSYTLRVKPIERATLRTLIAPLGKKAEVITMNAAEKYIEEVRQEGHQEGRQEGREEGRQEGRREKARQTLTKLVTLRFGTPSEAAQRRLAAASEEQLDAWSERILTAASIEEIWS